MNWAIPATTHKSIWLDRRQPVLHTFFRTVHFSVKPEVSAAASWLSHQGRRKNTLLGVSPGECELLLEIEIQRALLASADGRSPNLETYDLEEWPLIPRYRVLGYGILLPYLSMKFASDIFLGRVQSVKLIADIVQMLQAATENDLARSFEWAEEWGVVRQYMSMVRTAVGLMPDWDIEGIIPRISDPLAEIAERIA